MNFVEGTWPVPGDQGQSVRMAVSLPRDASQSLELSTSKYVNPKSTLLSPTP
jgi:hypothetical protein